MSGLVQYNSQRDSLRAMLIDDVKGIDALIPREVRRAGLTANRLCAIVLDATLRDPKILDCIPATIVRCVRTSAELGLEIGSPLGEAYIVPFKTKTQAVVATFVAGYKGLIKLAVGSPDIRNVEARLVYASDEFDYDYGTSPHIRHRPRPGDRRDDAVIAAYSVAFFAGAKATPGACQFEVMERDELNKIRARSKAKNGPWSTDTAAMFRKCPVRKLANTLDLSSLGRMKRAIERDEEPQWVKPVGLADLTSTSAATDGTEGAADGEVLEGEIVS